MTKRISVMLREETVEAVDRMVKPGDRSRFIEKAVEHFVAARSLNELRRGLELAAIRDRDLDREVAEDWSAVDREAWEILHKEKSVSRKKDTRGEVKSTSRRWTRR